MSVWSLVLLDELEPTVDKKNNSFLKRWWKPGSENLGKAGAENKLGRWVGQP